MTYNDVLSMPTYERRFFLSLHTKNLMEKQEKIEELKEKSTTKGSKGERKTKVSGEALKNKIKNGDLPIN